MGDALGCFLSKKSRAERNFHTDGVLPHIIQISCSGTIQAQLSRFYPSVHTQVRGDIAPVTMEHLHRQHLLLLTFFILDFFRHFANDLL